MKITRSLKEIPNGWYYIQHKNYYIADNKPLILEYLTSLFEIGDSNAYALKTKNKYYVFIEDGDLDVREKDAIDDLFILYPDMIVEDISNLKKKPIKVKGVKISIGHLAISIVLAALISGGFLLYKQKKEEAKKLEEMRKIALMKQREEEAKKQQEEYKCYTNVYDFLKNYVPFAKVEDNKIRVEVGNIKVEKELDMTPVKPVEINRIKLTSPDYRIKMNESGYVIKLGDYYECIAFLKENQIPVYIRRLSYEKDDNGFACKFVLSWDCISSGDSKHREPTKQDNDKI